jgi:hypothetical protein
MPPVYGNPLDGITSMIRETDIPISHEDIEENPNNRERDKKYMTLSTN